MVNCEMSYLDGNGEVHLYDYLFAVPSSGDLSKFSMYTVNYDGVLQIHRVFESRHQRMDPKVQLWDDCVNFWSNQEAKASSTIAFPFLSWPFPAPMSNNIKSLISGGTSSLSSGSSGANTPITPITPVTPSAERPFPQVDVHNAKLSITTESLDLAASSHKSKGSLTKFEYLDLEGHQPVSGSYKCNRDLLNETLETFLTERPSRGKEALLKNAVTDRKGATFNVTVQARNRYFDIHTSETILKGLPGSSPLRTCCSINQTDGGFQQTVARSQLQGKMPPRALADPFDRPVREGNAECKAYQAKLHTLGYLSQYLRAGIEAEIDEVWFASPLSSITRPSYEMMNHLAFALWRWHQMCSKTKELRLCAGFVPSRLGGREGDIDERSAYLHPTNDMTEGIRKQIPQELNLDRIPFTKPHKKGATTKGQVKVPHHFNLYNEPVYYKTYTPPKVSLWASFQPWKNFPKDSVRESALVSQARKLVDPCFYLGPPEHLQDKGTKLGDIVIDKVAKIYTLSGTWMHDHYASDETVPISWEEVAKRCGRADPNYQLPKDNQTLDPQDDETVKKENEDFYGPESKVHGAWGSHEALDLASGYNPRPKVNNESRQWLVALDLTWDGPMPQFEDLRTSVTATTPQARDTAEQSAASTSQEDEVAGEVIDEQARPASDVSQSSASQSSGEEDVTGKITDEHSGVDSQHTGCVSPEGHWASGELQKEQSGPERQTTALAMAENAQDQSYSESLDASFAEEDIIESTPPSHGKSTVSSNPDDSPAPGWRLPFDNSRANALVRSLARGDSEEEVQARLNRIRQRSPPPARPHVHNREDEDSVDYTDTWPKLNRLVPNPKLAKFAETSGQEEDGLDTSKLGQRNLGQPLRQAASAGLPAGPRTSTILGGVQQQTTSNSTSHSTSQLAESAPEEVAGNIASTGSAEVAAPAPEIRNRSDPTASAAADVGTSRNREARELLRPTRPRMFLPPAGADRILDENRHLFWPYTDVRGPPKPPTRKPKNLGKDKKAAAGAALRKEDGLGCQPLNKPESTLRESAEQGRQATLSNGSELSEPQVADGWLEYMAKRVAVEDATDDQPPTPASQETRRSVDDSPVGDEALQPDPCWLDYQSARAMSDAVFDAHVLREEAEWIAEIAAQRRDTQNEEDMLNWLQDTAALEAHEQGEVQRERQTRAATTAALAQYSDVSEIPASTTPSFSEYFFGSWALTLGAVVEKLPFVIPLS